MAEEYIPLREAAARTGLSASHLRLLARTGRIETRKVTTPLGWYYATTEAAVRAYVADEALRKKDPWKRRRG